MVARKTALALFAFSCSTALFAAENHPFTGKYREPLGFNVRPALVSRYNEIDPKEIEARAIEWHWLSRYNWRILKDYPRSAADLSTKRFGDFYTEVFPKVLFHISDWYNHALPKILSGPYSGIRVSADIWATYGFPNGNRSGPVFAFLENDMVELKMPATGDYLPGVPLKKIRFIAAEPGPKIVFPIIWINQDYKEWFDRRIAPRLAELEAIIQQRKKTGTLPPEFLSPADAYFKFTDGRQIPLRKGLLANCERLLTRAGLKKPVAPKIFD